jgi:hypothetical protein
MARPESGWSISKRFGDNGPDKVEIAFYNNRGRVTHIVAYANGETKVTEYKCSTTRKFDCDER